MSFILVILNMVTLEWAPQKCLHLACYTVDTAINIYIEELNERVLSQHCLSNVQHPMEKRPYNHTYRNLHNLYEYERK